MASDDPYEQFNTYEGRLASFQKSKKRGSTAGGRGKALNWPHKQITPASLAAAGFYFNPSPENPDNVACFLCAKALDGWEAGDDPLLEHLKHSSHCGWAILSAIEADIDEYAKEDPTQSHMAEARKATFAGRWPHEGKRGWKCKTKQLVEAGWRYAPSPESDDMAKCVHCGLALDGWEQNDKPYDEHHNRAPECNFFKLGGTKTSTTKKSTRGKAARGSKASRMSTQSVTTMASEAPSVADLTALTAGPEDSVLTTTSTTTTGEKKGRAKRATGAKSRKTKSKKQEAPEPEPEHEPVVGPEPTPVPEPQLEPSIVEAEAPKAAKPAPKSKRGKKRGSEAVEESTLTALQEPPAKKRPSKARSSVADSTVVDADGDVSMADEATSKTTGRKKGRKSSTQSSRKGSMASNLSASLASTHVPSEFLDDEAIERQLQEELDRQFSDDEIAMDSDSERSRRESKKLASQKAEQSADYAMFDPAPAEPDEAAVEAELQALQDEMKEQEQKVEEEKNAEEQETLVVPKKGRKAGTRKASKQSRSKKAKAATPEPIEEEPPVIEPPEPEPAQLEVVPLQQPEEADVSIGSTDTVVKKRVSVESSGDDRRHGRASDTSNASQDELQVVESAEPVEPPVKRKPGRPSKASVAARESQESSMVKPAASVPKPRGRPKKQSAEPRATMEATKPKNSRQSEADEQENEQPVVAPPPKARGRPKKQSVDPRPTVEAPKRQSLGQVQEDDQEDEQEDELMALQETKRPQPTPQPSQTRPTRPAMHRPQLESSLPPSTPGKTASPAMSMSSARRAVLSPSLSPQSSDAENQPPSSKPDTAKRIALAPVATPSRTLGSPSKRNVLAGLQSSMAWTAIDIEAILGTPRISDKENTAAERLLRQDKDLTSPEKKMTVEEWIYYNASEAERKLKQECETMVTSFEREGTRAMNVLEGLDVVD